MINYDKITLCSGASLIVPHHPDILTLDQIGKKIEMEKKGKDMQSFGLFDTAQPNFQTYYPDVKPEDLQPKENEFIRPVFRALSETIVHRKTNPIDFAFNKVLKGAMNLLKGQTVFANHEASIGNEIGSVAKVSWGLGYTAENGLIVPPGINAEFCIDGKSHPKIARGLMMDPPSIHSNSVTVSFGWEQSHPKMDRNEFMSKIGTYGDDKELIRRVVSEIVAFHETSLVAHGADPFAQLIRDKGIVNPEYTAAVTKLSEKIGTQVYFINYKTDTTSLSEEEQFQESEKQTETDNSTNNNMKEILAMLAAFIGVASLTEDEAKTKLGTDLKDLKLAELLQSKSDLAAEKLKVTNLTTERDDAKTKLATAEAEVTKLKGFETSIQALTEAKRTDVTRMYNVLFKDKIDAAMLASIAKADDALLTSLQGNYQALMDDKFPGQCNECKSTNVSRNSAVIDDNAGGAGQGKKKDGETTVLSDDEVTQSFLKGSKTNVSAMHGVEAKK